MSKIISGFPAIGKSTLTNDNPHMSVLDLDSSAFSSSDDFPNNYIECIKNVIGKYDYILISTHEQVRAMLEREGIHYTLVYPSIEIKDEYIKRFIDRGDSEYFINFLDRCYEDFIFLIEIETFPRLIELKSGQYLGNVISCI